MSVFAFTIVSYIAASVAAVLPVSSPLQPPRLNPHFSGVQRVCRLKKTGSPDANGWCFVKGAPPVKIVC